MNRQFVYSKDQLLIQTLRIFPSIFGLKLIFPTQQRLSIQMIYPRKKLKEKLNDEITIISLKLIIHLKEYCLLNGKKRRFQSNWLLIFIYLMTQLNSSIWKNQLDEKWNSSIENFNLIYTTFIQNNQIEKIHLFVIDFVHYQIVIFIILIIFKQKSDKIHWIDYFWIILVKKRNFCLFNCFLKQGVRLTTYSLIDTIFFFFLPSPKSQ